MMAVWLLEEGITVTMLIAFTVLALGLILAWVGLYVYSRREARKNRGRKNGQE